MSRLITRAHSRRPRTPCLGFEALESRHLMAAAIAVDAFADGEDADSAAGAPRNAGAPIAWTYRVTNPGDIPLTGVVLRDDAATPGQATDDFLPRAILPTPAARGTLEKTYDFPINEFVLHPTLPYMYATVGSQNTVAIINTDTLEVENQVFIGANPLGLAISPDGARVYVANTGSMFLGVLDTQTRLALPSLQMPELTYDVAVGKDGRLFVLGADTLMQVSSTTGERVGPNLTSRTYGGELAISPSREILYYGDFGLSPASLYKFDVKTTNVTQLWESDHGRTSGSNGQDVELSHDGSFVAYAAGAGQIGYSIAKYRTSDMAILGTFITGAYPREVAFSPDDKIAYTIHTSGKIDIWDTTTFLSLGSINTPSSSNAVELKTDRSGQRLFAAIENKVYVYSTGHFAGVNVGDLNFNRTLDREETWLFAAEGTAKFGERVSTASVTATATPDETVTALDLTHYRTNPWQLSLESTIDGRDADTAPGPQIGAGGSLAWTYVAANTGSVALANVVVTDDAGTPNLLTDDISPVFVGGDTNNNGLLEPGESWTFTSSQIVAAGVKSHTAKVSATPLGVAGETVPSSVITSDLTHYVGLQANLEVVTKVSNQVATSAPGPNVTVGTTASVQYEVKNTGNVSLTGISLYDTLGTPLATDDIVPSSVDTPSAVGNLLARYNLLSASRFVLHPTLPYLYVSAASSNSIAVINTDTLELEAEVFIGAIPRGLTISPDGSRLYVANSHSHFIGVFDTVSRTALPSLQVPEIVIDVEVGPRGLLYVLGQSSLMQFDPLTGEKAGPNFPVYVSSGEIAVSPQKDRLYYADYGSSPASLYQFDITGAVPVKLWESPHGGTSGSNGQDLAISDDGSFVAYATGAGQIGYSIAKYRTSDMAIVGTFNTGPYPREVTFSLDGTRAYTVNTSGHISIWDTTSFQSVGQISTAGEAFELQADRSNHLFAAFENELRVYSVGPAASFNVGDLNFNGRFDPGEIWRYSSSRAVTAGQHSGAAIVSATDTLGRQVTKSGASYYFSAGVAITVQATVNGADADSAPGPTIASGQAANWEYQVSNSGQVPFTRPVLIDDRGTPADTSDDIQPTHVSGDTNSNGLLDVGEVWKYAANTIAAVGARVHSAKVSAVPLNANAEPTDWATAVTAVDATHYHGRLPIFTVDQTVNGASADLPGNLSFPAGAALAWTTQITNTGNVPFQLAKVVSDNETPPVLGDDILPAPVTTLYGTGSLQKTLSGVAGITKMAMHPSQPILYATAYDANRLVIVDATTLIVVGSVFIGSGPRALEVSADGKRVYVANTSSNLVGVFDTETRTVLPGIAMPELVKDLELSSDGTLYVLGQSRIRQINSQTGAQSGSDIILSPADIAAGEIELSRDGTTLYYASSGPTAGSLYKINLEIEPPQVAWQSSVDTGLTGTNLTLNHDDTILSGAGGSKFSTDTMLVLGKFNPGGVPNEIIFGSDGRFSYIVAANNRIDIRSTETFLNVGSISTPTAARELLLDRSGQRIFAAFAGELRAYLITETITNVGDVNFNKIFDPDEVWSYTHSTIAKPGPRTHIMTASADIAGGDSLTVSDAAFYVGSASLLVRADSGGQPLVDTSLAISETYTISDNRFELAGSALRLKTGVTLSPTAAVPLTVEIRDSAGILLRKYLLHVTAESAPWHNAAIQADVDADGVVTPSDALAIINELNRNGTRRLVSMAYTANRVFFDVSGDGALAPLDALLVINRLNTGGLGEAPLVHDTVRSSAAAVTLAEAVSPAPVADGADEAVVSLLADEQLQAFWMWSHSNVGANDISNDADTEESIDQFIASLFNHR